ncbi:hypothetical protein TPL01_22180 [Sulfuriferula plumbiphila]|uniref:Uncharacterized protein n=1 Tax=Sulfuriferula plumbiphila TaxID=171865 RepID=A0A512L9D3_9PROT|nr:hypothetical protein [Sulfuriferula plumbiphila]BBP02998.1 hypothetical protein SFPGR_04200 [Sulfuriferula plumbiphila]GEP31080.1 hypothetical protein TPL01_22180 [Sulfuriferula plumbiphila]
MSTIKTILSLLAILCAYGVVGRMDYDDAVMMENAQKQAAHPDCLRVASASSTRQTQPVQTGLADISDESASKPADPCSALVY